MGTTGKLDQMRGRISAKEQNALSVRLELQADCYAGVWAHHTEKKYRAQGKQWLEKGDVEEALNAAQAIGDDALQKKSQGQIVPDSFTHGTSQQRMRWFANGFQTGSVKACDTFSAKQI
jgi:predicted metalloprotease